MPRQSKTDAYAAKLAEELKAHDRLDTERFDAVNTKLDGIHADVKSLLASRSYVRGAWAAIATISGAVSFVVGIVIAWMKH